MLMVLIGAVKEQSQPTVIATPIGSVVSIHGGLGSGGAINGSYTTSQYD